MSTAVASTAVLDRPAPEGRELDLRGLDFATRRRLLFAALRSLPPAGELRVLSGRPEDLHWLRYEMEARLDRSYRWSAATDGPQACSGTPAGNAVVVSPRSRQR